MPVPIILNITHQLPIAPPVAPSEDPPHAQSPSIALLPSHTSDADVPSLEDPLDSDSDRSSIREVQAMDEEIDEVELGM